MANAANTICRKRLHAAVFGHFSNGQMREVKWITQASFRARTASWVVTKPAHTVVCAAAASACLNRPMRYFVQ